MYRVIRNTSQFSEYPGFLVSTIIGCLVAIAIFVLVVNPLHNYVKYSLIGAYGDKTAIKDGFRSMNPRDNNHIVGLLMALVLNIGFAAPSYYDTEHFKRPKLQALTISLSGIATYFACFFVSYFAYSTLKLNNVFGVATATFQIDHADTSGYIFYFVYMLMYFLSITCLFSAIINLLPVFPLDMGDSLYEFLPLNWQDALRNNEIFVSLGIFILTFLALGSADGIIVRIGTSVMDKCFSVFRLIYR